jgi:hypothetical protein
VGLLHGALQVVGDLLVVARADRQALLEALTIGPTNPGAYNLISRERARMLPTSPENEKIMVQVNEEFWVKARDKATERFNAWHRDVRLTAVPALAFDVHDLDALRQVGKRFDDATVSRRHALLSKRADGWWIVDLGSTNGTRVNGVQAAEQPVGPGDRVELGDAVVELVEG